MKELTRRQIRLAVLRAARVRDGRLSFDDVELPACDALREVESVLRTWQSAVRHPDRTHLARLPAHLRPAAREAAGRLQARVSVGHGRQQRGRTTLLGRAEKEAERAVLRALERAGLSRETSGGTDTVVEIDDEVVVRCEHYVVWPRDAKNVTYPNAYSWRAHCCRREIRAPFGALWKATAKGNVVELPGVGELRASRGTGIALWIQGPRGGWRRAS